MNNINFFVNLDFVVVNIAVIFSRMQMILLPKQTITDIKTTKGIHSFYISIRYIFRLGKKKELSVEIHVNHVTFVEF